MDRSPRRIRKIEELLSAERKERQETAIRLSDSIEAIRAHATHIAAIVLAGQPKADEPLPEAWFRAQANFIANPKQSDDHFFISQRLSLLAPRAEWGQYSAGMFEVKPNGWLLVFTEGQPAWGEQDSVRFTRIFRKAPIWLLQFTAMAIDARLLKFHLPDVRKTLEWGSAGYKDARRWPRLPLGTMTAGDPISEFDMRRVWVTLACMQAHPFLDENVPDPDRMLKALDNPIMKDLLLALELDKPEHEWSRYERRRMRKFVERISLSRRADWSVGLG